MRDFVADVEQLARATTGGRWPRLGQIEGSDASGMVHFAIDDDGAFVSLYLDPAWWQTLGVAGLPAALRQAQQVAREKLLVAQLTFRRLIGPPSQTAGDGGVELRHGLSRTSDLGELLSSWRVTTAESSQRLYESDRRRNGEPTVVAGPEGLVRLSLVGGKITDVELAGWRLSEDSTDRLTADIRAALEEQRRGHHG